MFLLHFSIIQDTRRETWLRLLLPLKGKEQSNNILASVDKGQLSKVDNGHDQLCGQTWAAGDAWSSETKIGMRFPERSVTITAPFTPVAHNDPLKIMPLIVLGSSVRLYVYNWLAWDWHWSRKPWILLWENLRFWLAISSYGWDKSVRSGNSSVVRALDSWPKGPGFESGKKKARCWRLLSADYESHVT